MLSFEYRVKRKLKGIRAKYVPNNVSFRPVGIYKGIDDYVSTLNDTSLYKEVFPGYNSKLNISEEFYSRHSFPWALNADIPPAVVLKVKNGRLLTDTVNVAVITEDNKLLGNVSYEPDKNKIEDHSVLSQKYFTSPKKYDGLVYSLLIGGAGLDNYFHWFFDALPKLYLLRKSGWFDSIDWFVVPSYMRAYQKQTLNLLGIDEKKIIHGDKETHLQADVLVASTFIRNSPHIPVWTCEFIKQFTSKIPSNDAVSSPLIYISREDASYRRVLNEDKLVSKLEKYGFKTIKLSQLSFSEQFNLFRSAKVIVTPHGAGLTNLVFCQKGTSVIELFSNDYIVYLYYDLALKVGLNYDYLFCDSDTKPETTRQKMHQNIIVDVDKVIDKLKKLL